MPLVEVLPNTAAASAPGWAYVPDTGLDPVKAGHVPQNPRKRTAARPAGANAAADRTARQLLALQKRLTELDRDNARDVNIPVPKRAGEKEGGGRVPKGKTPATRRILIAQKTFANYLADEEAWAAQQSAPGDSTNNVVPVPVPVPVAVPSPSASAAGAAKGTKERGAVAKRRASAAVKGSAVGSGDGGTSSSPPRPNTAGSATASTLPKDVKMEDAPPSVDAAAAAPATSGTPAASHPASSSTSTSTSTSQPIPPPSQHPSTSTASTASGGGPVPHGRPPLPPPGAHPPPSAAAAYIAPAASALLPPLAPALQHLMDVATPTAPSEALLHALTHVPPLSFQAARTRPPSPSAPPPRRFCVLCGRLGPTRCAACGDALCGLDCARAHADVCAMGRVVRR